MKKATYQLMSAIEYAQNNDDFNLPSLASRKRLMPGQHVCLIFLPNSTWIWVNITGKTPTGYVGKIMSRLWNYTLPMLKLKGIKSGQTVRFMPKHVARIRPKV